MQFPHTFKTVDQTTYCLQVFSHLRYESLLNYIDHRILHEKKDFPKNWIVPFYLNLNCEFRYNIAEFYAK